MTNPNDTNVIDQEFGDAETDAFLASEAEAEASEPSVNNDKSVTNENEPDVKTEDHQNDEKLDGESSESDESNIDSNKQLSDAERYKAMAAEDRNRRKETQKQIEQLAQENKQLKETFNKILQKAQEQAEAEQQKEIVPDFTDDPIGALKYQNDQLRKEMDSMKTGLTQRQQQEAQQREFIQKQQQFIGTYKQSAAEFEKTTPDFKDAYNYLLESREKELKMSGYNDRQVAELLADDEAALVATAFQNQQNPAKVIYDLAKLRGYNTSGNMTQVQSKIAENQEKINNLERGVRASKSVNSGGVNAKDSLTLEAVASMSEDELESVDWNRLMKLG